MIHAAKGTNSRGAGNSGKRAFSISEMGRAPLDIWTQNFMTKEPIAPLDGALPKVQEAVYSSAAVAGAVRKADKALWEFEPKDGIRELGAGANKCILLLLPAREELRTLQEELRTAYFSAWESAGLQGPRAPHPADLADVEFAHLLSGVLASLQGAYRSIIGGGEKAKSALFDFAHSSKEEFFSRMGGCGGA